MAASAARRNSPTACCSNSCGGQGRARGEQRYFAAVEITLERICQGGIYDHLGGGFSRYSVDERWLVPHFEKMLYDNAQLLELLALAHRRSGNPLFQHARAGDRRLARARDDDGGGRVLRLARRRFRRRGGQVLRLVARRDRARHRQGRGGILRAALRRHAREGNFEGHTILNRLARVPATPEDERGSRSLRRRLLAVRDKRVRPGLDDKVLADWNGLMIAALVNAGVASSTSRRGCRWRRARSCSSPAR